MIDVTGQRRRRFLSTSTALVGSTGLAAAAWPFAAAWRPSERALAEGAPVSVDISKLAPGQQMTVEWRRKPVWVLHRTPQMLESLNAVVPRLRDPDSRAKDQQPPYAANPHRSRRPDHLVVVALCTHLGCVPRFRPENAPADLGGAWAGGYFCPCHGSRFDLAGRVFKGVPAPLNLRVPPYEYVERDVIQIGADESGA